MSGYRLTDPSSVEYGYRPPPNLLGDFRLRLRPEFIISPRGWVAQPHVGPVLPAVVPLVVDSALRPSFAEVSRDIAAAPARDPTELAAARLRRANTAFWDKVQLFIRDTDGMRDKAADLAKDSLWPSRIVPGHRNAATGEAAEGAKIRPDGSLDYGDMDGLISGSRLSLPGSVKWVGRRFGMASDLDVSFFFFADKDALTANRPDLLISGAGVEAKGQTSSGYEVTVLVGAGRDVAGGAAGFLTIGLAPKPKIEKK